MRTYYKSARKNEKCTSCRRRACIVRELEKLYRRDFQFRRHFPWFFVVQRVTLLSPVSSDLSRSLMPFNFPRLETSNLAILPFSRILVYDLSVEC